MLRHLPNVLTSLRIVAVPVLIGLIVGHRQGAFAGLLIACLVGDIADGVLARVLRATSPLGATLDSVADALLFVVAAIGAWRFEPDILRAHPIAFGLLPALWLSEYAAAFLRYGRLSSFHTHAARVSAYALGILVGMMFIGVFHAWLLQLTVILVVVSTMEEFALLWLLPTWTADVRGVWWVLRAKRATRP